MKYNNYIHKSGFDQRVRQFEKNAYVREVSATTKEKKTLEIGKVMHEFK